MTTFGNIIWIIFGGIFIAIEYVLASFTLMITIVGIPFGLQTLKLAELALFPFGKKIVQNDTSSGCISALMNIIWFFVGSLPIALTHLGLGLLFYITIIGIPFGNQHFKLMKLLFYITIIGIPFGNQHFKLMKLAFVPFGKKIV